MNRLRIAEIARANRNWSIRELADAMGMEPKILSRWNQGTAYPRLHSLIKLLRHLECSLQDLVGHGWYVQNKGVLTQYRNAKDVDETIAIVEQSIKKGQDEIQDPYTLSRFLARMNVNLTVLNRIRKGFPND